MQKKDRKKKQEFHKRKVKFNEEEHLDFEQLKSRVCAALDKLGHQVFSLEPGGYTLHNWMTSFNLLLDDFEEKTNGSLPKNYYDSRLRLTADLLKPVDTSDIDPEIQKVEGEIESAKSRITELTRESNAKIEERRRNALKIDHLKGERITLQKKLDSANDDLAKLKKKKSIFSRLMSNSREKSPVDVAKEKVDSIQGEIDSINKQIEELEEDSISPVDGIDDELAEANSKLDNLQQSLAEWGERKNARLQLTDKRVETTTALSGIISSLKLESVVAEKEN